MIVDYPPDAIEVTQFRRKIYTDDLGLSALLVSSYRYANRRTEDKFAHWFSDEKFLHNGFDRVLIYYHGGVAVGMCGGTHYNSSLYRCVQMYYILKSARRVPGLNTLHFRENGFFDWQLARAKSLGVDAAFISVDTFDQKHVNMFDAMRGNRTGFGQMSNAVRKYTADDLVYLDNTYNIMHTMQRVCYYPLVDNVDFDKCINQ